MGKAKIVSHIGGGQYNVLINNDLTNVNRYITRITDAQTLNNSQITAKEAKLVTAQAELDTAYTNNQIEIDAYQTCIEINGGLDKCITERDNQLETQKIFEENSLVVRKINQSLDSLKVLRAKYIKQLAQFNNVKPEWEPDVIWSADLADGVDGALISANTIVSTIDIFSFDLKKYERWIVPSTHGRDPSYSVDFGKTASVLSNDPNGFMFNFNMRGPMMAWNPPYRLATITAIDENTGLASVSYFQLKDEWGVSYNGNEPTTNIPFDYMNTGYKSFQVGDAVIVSFCKVKMSSPLIIGYYSNPKSELAKLVLFANYYTSANGTDFDVAKMTDVNMLEADFINFAFYRSGSTYQAQSYISEGSVINVLYNTFISSDVNYPTGSLPYTAPTITAYASSVITVDNFYWQSISNHYGAHIKSGKLITFVVGDYISGVATVYRYVNGTLDQTLTHTSSAPITLGTSLNIFKARGGMQYNESDSTSRFVLFGLDGATNINHSYYYEINDALPVATLSLIKTEESQDTVMNARWDGTGTVYIRDDYGNSSYILIGCYLENNVWKEFRTYWKVSDLTWWETIIPGGSQGTSQTYTITTGVSFDGVVSSWQEQMIDIPKTGFYSFKVVGDTLTSVIDVPSKTYSTNYKHRQVDAFLYGPIYTVSKSLSVYSKGSLLQSSSTAHLPPFNYNDYFDPIVLPPIGSNLFFAPQGVASSEDNLVISLTSAYTEGYYYNGSQVTYPSNISHHMGKNVALIKDKIINIKITSNNADPTKAKTGDIITLTFSQTSAMTSVTVNIAGHSVTPVQAGDNYTATWTVLAIDPQAIVSFNITADGDSFERTTGIGRCSEVTIDTEKPVATVTDNFQAINESFYFTIIWNEETTALAITDLITTSGRIIRFERDLINSNKYLVKVLPALDVTLVNLQINSSAVTDLAGNLNDLGNYNAVI